jgi:gamma-glutamyltranspeptidase/glutathione hydrolase
MLTNATTGDLMCTFGVMGGFMQPQGHVQVLLNMLEFGMHPQQALDAARYIVDTSAAGVQYGAVTLEDGIPPATIAALRAMGHEVRGPSVGVSARSTFGWGQAITRGAWWNSNSTIADDPTVWWVGVDPRCDGNAAVY